MISTEEMLKRMNVTMQQIRDELILARQDRREKMLADQKISDRKHQ